MSTWASKLTRAVAAIATAAGILAATSAALAGTRAPVASRLARDHVAMHSTRATSCHVANNGEGFGYTYLLSLSVNRTTCATGLSLVRHKGKLSGWKCVKKMLDSSPTQYDAQMTCAAAAKQVIYKYAQNT